MEDTAGFKDRKGLLIFSGIILIATGGISFLFSLLILFTIALQQTVGYVDQQIPIISVLPGVLMYVAIAAIFISLGVGSIRTKRWARPLTLLLSWLTLIGGAIVLVLISFYARDILEQLGAAIQGDPIISNLVLILMYVVTIVFFIAIPGIFILVYKSNDVIQTLQNRDPRESWTDKCPLPILAHGFFLLNMAIIPAILLSSFVAPFFGIFIYGLPAAIIWFANSIICIYLAIRVCRLDTRAWYYSLYLFLIWMISSFITLLYNDYMDIYKYMNYPPEQMAMLENMKYMSNSNMLIMTVLSFVSYLIFFFYANKYFRVKK